MAESATVITLRAKRDQIEGLIAHLEGRLKDARTDLAHVNATLNKAGLGHSRCHTFS